MKKKPSEIKIDQDHCVRDVLSILTLFAYREINKKANIIQFLQSTFIKSGNYKCYYNHKLIILTGNMLNNKSYFQM